MSRTYVVKEGDSPWTICVAYTGAGARWGELVAANPQKATGSDGNFRTLVPGETLNLPDSWDPDENGYVSPHASQVEPGDTGAVDPLPPPTPLQAVATDDIIPARFKATNPHPGKWLVRDDFVALLELARATNQNPANLALLFFNESWWVPWAGGHDITNGAVVAGGLSQITSSISVVSAETRNAIPTMSAAQQLRGPILAQYTAYGFTKPLPAQVLYAYNAAPARVGNGSDGNVLYSAAPDDRAYVISQVAKADPKQRVFHGREQELYANNYSLDANHDGVITIGDLRAILTADAGNVAYQRILAALNFVAKDSGLGPFAPTFGAPLATPGGSTGSTGGGGGGAALGLLALIFLAASGP